MEELMKKEQNISQVEWEVNYVQIVFQVII